MSTKIEWCDETINPIVGCKKISEGCDNCYAARFVKRGMCEQHKAVKAWDGTVRWAESLPLQAVAKFRKPRKIFIGSMTDLFLSTNGKNAREDWLDIIMGVICANPKHTFIILTKRPLIAKDYFDRWIDFMHRDMPDNLWLGVSAENQARADERIPILLDIPAKVRFVSCEPMLGPIYLNPTDLGGAGRFGRNYGMPQIDWVICGAETGAGKRPMDPEWAESLCDQCGAAGIPFFFKKHTNGQNGVRGLSWHQFPVTE